MRPQLPPTRTEVTRRRASFLRALEPRSLLSTWIDTSSRATVTAHYVDQYLPSVGVPMGWTGSYATGDAGTTSTAYQDAIFRRINFYRRLAGVPDLTGLDPVYSRKDQQAALMMSANGLSHSPPTTWTFYTAEGAEAAGNSNLALGAAGPSAIDLYMNDPGGGNYPVGHRLWMLYSQTQKMGTGDVPGSGTYWAANAMWVFDPHLWDARPATRTPYVAWPSPGYVPYQLWTERWSFSYAGADFSTAQVSVTRNGATLATTLNPVFSGFGENSMTWQMPAVPTAERANVNVYDVSISNVKVNGVARSFSYTVNTFDPTVTQPAAAFDLESPGVTLTFAKPVNASTVAPDDVVATNLTTGATIAIASTGIVASGAGSAVTFKLPATAPDGRYRFSFARGNITATDGSGFDSIAVEGANIFLLAGDTDHDGTVGFNDLLRLARHYGQPGVSYADGNVDRSPDGLATFNDLLVIARNYGHALNVSANLVIQGNGFGLFDTDAGAALAGEARHPTRKAPWASGFF